MATRSIVPRSNSEGSLGTTLKRWLTAFIDTLTLTNPLDVPSGGTGVGTLTEGGLLVGGGSGDITALAVATNGQIPIGDGTTAPTLATITAGAGIDITNGAGSITIDVDLKANGGLVIETTELAVDLGASAITGTLAVGDGGTGVGTFTLNGILYGNAATSVLVTAAGTVAGQLLTCGATPFVPVWTTATYPATTTVNQLLYSSSANVVAGLATGNSGVLVTSGAGIPSIATDIPTAVTIGSAYIYRAAGTDVPATDGGTGASTLTDHGVLVGSGTDPVTALAVGTNGQVLVGSTGADPVFATITDGEGIDTTLGAGTLTIAAETASETNPGVIEIATDAETIAGSDTARAITASNLKAKLGTQTDGGLLVGAGQTAAVEALAAGATTEILVGGGVGVNPVWTTATGTGAPVRATNPTLAGATMTDAIDTAYATVASHATTSAIWAAAGNVINFTGAETITDLPAAPQAGAQRTLICAGACIWTHAGNLTVQGAANRTCVAGDVVIVTAITTTTFRINFIAQTETGSGSTVRATNPVLAGPALGTPSSGDLQNCTGYPNVMLGDGTSGRVLRYSRLKINDGTNADTIKCTLINQWNGDSAGVVDNISKGATTGGYTLLANGFQLTLTDATLITGNCVATLSVVTAYTTNPQIVFYPATVSGIQLNFITIAGADVDITTYTGETQVDILYVTSA